MSRSNPFCLRSLPAATTSFSPVLAMGASDGGSAFEIRTTFVRAPDSRRL
jgi:hypothetical protein